MTRSGRSSQHARSIMSFAKPTPALTDAFSLLRQSGVILQNGRRKLTRLLSQLVKLKVWLKVLQPHRRVSARHR